MSMNSFIMGYDFVGTVISTTSPSESPTKLKLPPGTPVFGMTRPGHARPQHSGAHQAYLVAEDDFLLWKRPEDISELEAVRITSAVLTAADALFNVLGFGFPPAGDGVPGRDPKGEAVLIWGGAGSVGWAAVQLAREAGFGTILTTASEGNLGKLRGAGATHVFDYRKGEAVVEEIKGVLEREGVKLGVVFDAVGVGLGIFEPEGREKGRYEESSAALAKRCVDEGLLGRGEVKLCCVLPVLQDPDWVFTLYSRKHDGEQIREHPGWWQRQEKVVDWVVENYKAVWKELAVPRVVRDADEAVAAIRDVFEGKVGAEKVVIQHPMK
ncbi:hypothetical protein B0T16DRAFT_395671 [Cercophora newfieldiana]|uniref:Alcohol dehydrogenase-like C-terminal domain-containing protein n=1 Tax=Cercophora newfieldiana TaxID=92897 RepID=A0AA39YLH4_9PEZI|nr:hypothetical protein B0T16DRAFT_395671 [Cercophora newfieldiana]